MPILLKLSIFSEIWAKIEFFAKNVLHIGISSGFLLIKDGKDVSNIYCKIQDHTKKIVLKIVIFNISWLHQPSSPSDFDGLPYPWVR